MALFAASTGISERLVNSCLTTYLANIAAPQSASIVISTPVLVQGNAQSVVLDGEFAVISARATLLANTQGQVDITFRFASRTSSTSPSGRGLSIEIGRKGPGT